MAKQEILDFITQERGKGASDDRIREHALKKGWDAGDVNGAFASLALAENPLTARETQRTPGKKKSYVPQVVSIVVLLFIAMGVYAFLPTIRGSLSAAVATITVKNITFSDVPFVPFAPTPSGAVPAPSVLDKVASLLTRNTSLPSAPSPSNPSTNTNNSTGYVAVASPAPQATPAQTSVSTEPSVKVHADYVSVQPGSAVTLTWSSANATTCRASSGFSTGGATSGSAVAHPVLSTSYAVTCVGPAGTARESVFVAVSADAAAVPSSSGNTTSTGDTTPPPTGTTVPDPVPPTPGDPTPPATSTPPAPATPPPAPSIPGGTYAVYPGCESPAASYARTLYFDPVNGNDTTGDGSQAKPLQSISAYATARKLMSGDHLVLLPGHHVGFSASTKNAGLTGSGWVWLDFRSGATLDSLTLNGIGRWLVTNASITYPTGGIMLLSLTGTHDIVVADSNLYTDTDSSGWSATKWISGTDTGIFSDSSTCLSFLRNNIYNVRHGLIVFTRSGSPDPAANSIKALVLHNVVKNHSGDGMRPLGSDIIMSYNTILDEYVSIADGDSNHDDGIQGFALPIGTVYGNVTIDHNWVQETTNPNRPLNAGMQGISSFDGVYTNLRITNNVVITSIYHGISWYGINNALIDHNTVVQWTTNGYTTRIYVPIGKSSEGSPVPYNVTVSNNVAGLVSGNSTVTLTNNYNYGGQRPTGLFMALDPVNNVYDLRPKPGGPLDGKNIGADLTQPLAVAHAGRAASIAEGDGAPQGRNLAAVEVARPGFLAWIDGVLAAIWHAIASLFQF